MWRSCKNSLLYYATRSVGSKFDAHWRKRDIMDPLSGVDGFVDRVLNKFSRYSETYLSSLDNLQAHIETLQRELLTDAEPDADLSITAVMIWEQCVKKIREVMQQMGQEHRDMHGGVSKCGKEIDKIFASDFTGVTRRSECYEGDSESRQKVNMLIAEHFLSQGMLDVAETLAKESGINLNSKNKSVFEELNCIMNALRNHDLDPALGWAQEHKNELICHSSHLEFALHRMKFIQLLKEGLQKQTEILLYAKKFEPFMPRHTKEIQSLMGALLYLKQGLAESKYGHLLDESNWLEICSLFSKDACTVLGLPVNSPLSRILNAGTIALPALLNLKQVMQQRQVAGVWTQHGDELPIEIDLGDNNHYHSVFACPILRQQTSDSNPPMRLNCGHVISKDALNKLASNNRLKCPYCPVESMLADAKRVYF